MAPVTYELSGYGGINYGSAGSNVDTETGISYGVISLNSLSGDVLDNDAFEYQYAGPNCPDCGNTVKASDDATLFDGYEGELDDDGTPEWFDHKDYTCLDCEQCLWSDVVWSDESTGWKYDQDGYVLTNCLDNDAFVLKSPYWTYAQYCSPCVPGAGNLDTPTESGVGVKCYALGHEWFEGGVAPYPVWSMAGEVVEAAP